MSNQINPEWIANRLAPARAWQEFLERYNEKYLELDKELKSVKTELSKQIEQLTQALLATETPPLDETELGRRLKGVEAQLEQLQRFPERVENRQREIISQVQDELAELNLPPGEDWLASLTVALMDAMEPMIQREIQAERGQQREDIEGIGKQVNVALVRLTAVVERLDHLQNDMQAVQPDELIKRVEAVIGQLTIPSAAEIVDALNDRFNALDRFIEQQARLIQGQGEQAEIVTLLGETVGVLRKEMLAEVHLQSGQIQSHINEKFSLMASEFIEQFKPIQEYREVIEAAIQRLGTFSEGLTSEFASLKNELQDEVGALKAQQEAINETAGNLSNALGTLDEHAQQNAQSVHALEGAAKNLETFPAESLLPKLQGLLESALAEQKSAQAEHQKAFERKTAQAVADMSRKVEELQQANQQLHQTVGQLQSVTTQPELVAILVEAVERKIEAVFIEHEQGEKVPFPPFDDARRYEVAMECLGRFKKGEDLTVLDEAQKRFNSLKQVYSQNLSHYPIFAAEIENRLAEIYAHLTQDRAGKRCAKTAKELIEAHYGFQIREEKELYAQIELNARWIDKGSMKASTTQPYTSTPTLEGDE